jgi:hypothetical protein
VESESAASSVMIFDMVRVPVLSKSEFLFVITVSSGNQTASETGHPSSQA